MKVREIRIVVSQATRLAISDASSRCFAHRARSTSVPSGGFGRQTNVPNQRSAINKNRSGAEGDDYDSVNEASNEPELRMSCIQKRQERILR